jgi:hypothetical protein
MFAFQSPDFAAGGGVETSANGAADDGVLGL